MHKNIQNYLKPAGQPIPTLGAATPPRPIGAPQSGRPWEDQGRPTLEAVDPPWEEVVSSSPGRLEGVLRRLVEEASSNPNQATGTNVSSNFIQSCSQASISSIFSVVQAWWVPGWLVLGLEVLQELELEALPAPLVQGDDDDEDDDDVEEEDSDETLPAPFARGDDQSILEFFYPITIVVHNSTGALVVL